MLQAMFIMREIGVSNDNMLLINIKLKLCVILQAKALNIEKQDSNLEG